MREGKKLKMMHLQPLIKGDKICQALTKRIERTLKLRKGEWVVKSWEHYCNIIAYVASTINREVR